MRRQKCRARGAPQHKPTRSKALPGRRKPSGAHSSGSPLPARTPQTAPECQALSKKLRALKKISSYLQKLPQAALSAPPAKRQKKCRKGAPARRFRQKISRAEARHGACYSHSMVEGGFEEMSRQTRFTPFTSFIMRFEILASRSCGMWAQSAVIASRLSTILSAMTLS